LLSVIIVGIFAFLLKPFSSMMMKIIPGTEKVLPLWPEYLDKRYLYNSTKAFEAVTKELDREMMLAQRNYDEAMKLIDKFNKSSKRSIFYIDLIIDNLQKEIMRYLDRVSQLQLSKKDTVKLFVYSSMVDDIERIGDHVTNLVHLAEYKSMWKVGFSKDAEEEIKSVLKLVAENISDARFLITKKSKEKIIAITEREKLVDITIKQAREDHLNRFYRGVCLAMAGPIYNDMLVNFERISDHCMNIAEYVEQLD
jgi:phosphate:Na+ symporter